MVNRQFVHEQVYFVSLLGVAVGLPLNKIVLSVSGLLMALNWLIQGGFKDKISILKKQKAGLLMSLLYILLAFTLLYSEHLQYGINDLRIKLPMLLFPVVILSSPTLSKTKYRWILHAFLFTVVLVTSINLFNYHIGIYRSDSREMSLFGSHIRLSLMVTFAFFFSLYSGWKQKNMFSAIYYLVAIWLLIYAYNSEVLTGYFGLIIGIMFLIFWNIIQQFNKHKKIAIIVSSILSLFVFYLFYLAIYPIPKEEITEADLKSKTAFGGIYHHDTTSSILENGYYIHYFICHEELDSMLVLRTGKPLTELSRESPDFFPTLIRYMSSLGLRKDAAGFAQLSEEDLENIKKGIPSVVYARGGIKSRLSRITMELQKHLEGADPNGSTIQQRIEYWRTGKDIIVRNPIFGVGVGDVQEAYNVQYEMNNSRLHAENRLHSHQQFMTIWISGGVLALLIFLVHIILVLKISIEKKSILLYLFSVIIVFSYFFEDTLETQVGVTLAAYFLSLLLKQEQETPFFDEQKDKKS